MNSCVRLLLRVCEAIAGVFWYSNGVWEVGGGLRATSDDCSIGLESRLSGVFCSRCGTLIGQNDKGQGWGYLFRCLSLCKYPKTTTFLKKHLLPTSQSS